MRDFDYWNDASQPAAPSTDTAQSTPADNRASSSGSDGWDDMPPMTLDEQLAAHQARRGRFLQSILLMLGFFAAGIWLLWGQRALIQYVFASPDTPPQVVDVTTVTPDALQHNRYVTVTGITEHRGMKQKFVRDVLPWRREYWYFRLLGSRGVFIEVDPDPDTYGLLTRMTVSGRVVDPVSEPVYQPLLKAYQERFFTKAQQSVRIVQVGVRPGHGRMPFMIVFGVLGLLATINVITVLRFLRFLRQRPGARG